MADLRDSIADAMKDIDSAEDSSNEAKAEPVQDVDESDTDIQSDTTGDTAADSDSVEVDTDKAVPLETKEPATPAVELPPPPASWKGDAKQVWADLPDAARNEVIRREGNVNRMLAETAEVRQFASTINEVVQRHSQRINSFNMPPAQVFNQLLEADRMLATAEPVQKAQYMAKLIKDYGVDVGDLDNALSGAVPAIPDVSRQVAAQVEAALAPFRQQQQAEQLALQQTVAQTIDSMTDNPEFPLFDTVRDDMADLIEIKSNRGIYLSLEEAYSLITGQSPIAKQQQQINTVKQNNATAAKAKSAAVSVSGNPASSTGQSDPKDLRGTIASAIDGLR